MKSTLPLPENKKLSVTHRVESGCLGPEGRDHIIEFCKFAQSKFSTLDSDYVIWNIVRKKDKKLPEMEYRVFGKKMSHAQAEKYLAIFGKNLDEFEGHLCDELTTLINQFMKR